MLCYSCLTTSHSSGNSSITRDEFRNHGSERMIARRGCPPKSEANLKTIRWRFIPPGAPFMGGAWERHFQRVRLEQPRAVARLSTASRYVLEPLAGISARVTTPAGPHGRGEALKIGDVVLIADNTLPRNTWPRGVITAVYPGTDGVTRVADVQTKNGVLRRPEDSRRHQRDRPSSLRRYVAQQSTTYGGRMFGTAITEVEL
ncbi:hypothetical protein EVAR_90646_1 [Eumeta japonica]|uniref:DUF5641 domain-containing protein n=1 Tax=Eumeta variegata TaxID=151549 RepID=A0A4C1SY36_EUMVA|nr:hypothetical protein EVAR_90646_1 [Eumeta japonica]